MVCTGCGRIVAHDADPFRCPGARPGDDVDHVLRRSLAIPPEHQAALRDVFLAIDDHPFLRYAPLLHVARLLPTRGADTGAYPDLVRRLDRAIAGVDGRGFRVTPFEPSPALGRAVGLDGPVHIKDETGNVGRTHKGRHLMGILVYLEASRAHARLAIASCGNAALAAAILARAADRPLDVFIPESADAPIVDRLSSLGATLTICPRRRGERGDPCYHAFRRAVEKGAVPFACQGNENGLTIDGGKTLAWEIVSTLVTRKETLDHLVVQVGGGALASACAQALEEAVALGAIPRMPRVHAVQTVGAAPLRRAYRRLVSELAATHTMPEPSRGDGVARDAPQAAWLADHVTEEAIDATLTGAARRRAAFMSPWATTPESVATAILDDETYDWVGVVRGMLRSGGVPVVVDDDELRRAHALARQHTTIPVSISGAAGLAGLLALREAGVIGPRDRAAVLFSGAERPWDLAGA